MERSSDSQSSVLGGWGVELSEQEALGGRGGVQSQHQSPRVCCNQETNGQCSGACIHAVARGCQRAFPMLLWKYSKSLLPPFSGFRTRRIKKSTADKHCFRHLTLVFDLVTQTVQNEQIRCLQQKAFHFGLLKCQAGGQSSPTKLGNISPPGHRVGTGS